MLDTIILSIPRRSYSIFKPHMFSPNADILNGAGFFLVKCVNNATATDKRNKTYRPRLTLMKRMTDKGIEIPLKIEFSAPKMLFDNNVDELKETDAENVAKAITRNLFEMGVMVSSRDILLASVSAFHPSKNIALKEGYTSGFVIRELKKIDVSKKLDLQQDRFRNEGQSLHIHANSHELVFYDKVQDLRKPEKRAMDKDQNSVQASLFDVLALKEKVEILRMEARLAKKVKLNATFRRLGLKENPTFQEVFDKKLCQLILLDYWNTLILRDNLFLFDVESNPKDTLERVFRNRPKISPKEAIFLVGLKVLSKEGIRTTRAIVEEYSTSRTWYRIAKGFDVLNQVSDKVYHGWVKQISDALETFTPYRLRDG